MAERTLAEALAHAEQRKLLHCELPQGECAWITPSVSGWCDACRQRYNLEVYDNHDIELLTAEVLRLRAELEQAPERSRMAMLERIGLLKKAEK